MAVLDELYGAGGASGQVGLTRFRRAIDLAGGLGEIRLEAYLRGWRASVLSSGPGGRDPQVVADAEQDLRSAIALTSAAGEQKLRARCAADLALLLGRNGGGDVEEAIGLLRDCMLVETEKSDPEVWATNCTNLSVLYVRRRAGVRSENLRTAESLCHAAFRVRSIERNAIDWAYTAINLAHALIEGAHSGGPGAAVGLDRALDLSERAAEVCVAAGAAQLACGALHNATAAVVGSLRRSLAAQAQRRAEEVATRPEVVDIVARVGLPDGSVPEQIVRIAELATSNPEQLGCSTVPAWATSVTNLVLSDDDHELVQRGSLLGERVRALESATPEVRTKNCKLRDDLRHVARLPDRARTAPLAEDLASVRIEDDPADVLDLAERLGAIHSDQRDWSAAAAAYARATAALDWIYEESGSRASRMATLSAHYKLVEFAAYATAKAGRPKDAVVLLENGRARGLGADVARDSAAIARLRAHAPELVADLEAARQALADLERQPTAEDHPSSLGAPSANVLRRELRTAIDRIRDMAGFADFLTGVSPTEIAAVARPDCPLAYLVTTPDGSLVLVVEPGDEEVELRVTALWSGVTGRQLVSCLGRFEPVAPRGLMVSSGEVLDAEIESAQRLLGLAFGQNLMDFLKTRNASGVQIVPCGILAALPVTTAMVTDGGVARPISELVTVTVTPSAYVHQICRERATARAGRAHLLVGVGDPETDDPRRALVWSRAEIRAIARIRGLDRALTREGAEATRAFLTEHAGAASHLHLAAHGFSDPFDAMSSGVTMADGTVTAAGLYESAELAAQVVVVSACESGRIGIRDAPNEFRGLPLALIACGAASVVGSLWPVDDLATSLLMVRFHEELLREEDAEASSPDAVAKSLRSAQAWLRTATHEDLRIFRMRHNLSRRTRGESGRGGDLLAPRHPPAASTTQRPFAAPRFWASFFAVG